jgi:hypothetical protein
LFYCLDLLHNNHAIFLTIYFFFHIYRVLPLPSIKLIEDGKENNNDNDNNNENEKSPLSKITKNNILRSFKNFKKYLKKFKNEVSFDFENSREKNQNKVTELKNGNSDDVIEDEVEKEDEKEVEVGEKEEEEEEEEEEEGESSVTVTPAQQLLLDILKRYQIILFHHLIYLRPICSIHSVINSIKLFSSILIYFLIFILHTNSLFNIQY